MYVSLTDDSRIDITDLFYDVEKTKAWLSHMLRQAAVNPSHLSLPEISSVFEYNMGVIETEFGTRGLPPNVTSDILSPVRAVYLELRAKLNN